MRSTALLKLRPDDGRPYRLPNTWRIIPWGAMIPGRIAMHYIGVPKYAPTGSPPRNARPYSADSAKKILMDVAVTLLQYTSSGLKSMPGIHLDPSMTIRALRS